MNYIKVTIKDKNTLILESDAKKGDLINLSELMHVDTSIIEESILKANNEVYLQKEIELTKSLNLSFENRLKDELLKYQIENKELESKLSNLKDIITNELKLIHLEEINKLNSEITNLKNSYEIKSLKDTEGLNKEIVELKSAKDILSNKLESVTEKFKLENINNIQVIESKHKEEMINIKEELSNLKRQKSSLNVKLIGEDLETWCDNEFNATNMVLNDNIVWHKDNKVKDGTKADFIYKVYATNEKLDSELLTSAILEMKSEDPLAPNTQDIKAILKKLDSDRVKKNMEYAILVSELNIDASNDLPIKVVNEYEKMYIVRPQYFMALLNIITALGLKYKDILLANEEKRINFLEYETILSEFEEMKEDILTKSIKYIKDQLDIIIRQSDAINAANIKINDSAKLILDRHINTVINKIENFNIKKIGKDINNIS